MDKILISNRYNILFLALYTLISSGVFFYILYNQVPSDIGAHTQILLRFLDMGSFPTPPLYYSLVYVLHFIMPYKEGFGMAAWLVLTAAGFFKYLWSINYLMSYCPQVNSRYVNIFAFSLMFFAPITLFGFEGEKWYLAKFTSLIWHNSTTLLSLPFCVLLFYYSVQFLEDRNGELLRKIIVTSIIIVLIKPSFVLAFLPAFPITILLIDKELSSSFFKSLALVVPVTAIIILEKIIIYNVNTIDSHLEEGLIQGIGIRPFFLWVYYSETPIWDVISSFLFPFFFIILNYKQISKDPHFIFSGNLIAFGLFIYFTFIETGPRMMDGNFFWQVILTLFIGYLVLGKHLLNSFFRRDNSAYGGFGLKNNFLLALFLLHVIGGVAYTVRIFVTHSIY